MPIQELARTEVVTAAPEAPASELARLMRDEGVGSVVITNDDEPVGIVTDRDLATRVVAEEATPNTQSAENIMSKDLCTVTPAGGFYEATEVMAEHGIRRLPVCSDDGTLEGILTIDDLSELIADEQQQLASVIRNQRPPY